MFTLKSILLTIFLCPAIVSSYENLASIYFGAGDGVDIRYDRYFKNYGVGISPSLGTLAYSKVYWNSEDRQLTWYSPAIHFSYRSQIYKNHYLIPEIKIVYSYWNSYRMVDKKHKITTLYGVLPRLAYSVSFNRIWTSVYAGLFGYLVHDWNENALREYRPLPKNGFNSGMPALGLLVGYKF